MTKQFPYVGHLTEDQIERRVERMTDKLDAAYVVHQTMSTAEYEEWSKAIESWADREYANRNRAA